MSVCGTTTPASRRYQRRMLVTMLLYLAVTLGVVTIVKHTHLHGWLLYAIALLPALPMLAMMGALGVYVQEEKDEYIRLITMRSLLAGTAVLLAVLVVNDVLRSISGAAVLPAFTGWVVFFLAFGAAQGLQTMGNRVRDDA